MRLIDADALWEQISNAKPNDALSLIEDAPTVDAVDVVRCKDCVHWFKGICSGHSDNIYMDENDFCSLGERREDADT